MSDNNKRPPGYVPLTIHELAAGQKGKRGTAFDYVFSLDARAVDDSVLSSSAARAAVGQPRNGGRPHGERGEGGFGGRSDQGRGRRSNRRGRNRRGFGSQDGEGSGSWNEAAGSEESSVPQESSGDSLRAAAPQEEI